MLQWPTGRYEVLRELGSGALGAVSLVRDKFHQGRLVALKRFHRDSLSAEAIADLRRHFLLLRRVRHPNVARVFDVAYSQAENTMLVTTEFVEGVGVVSALRSQGEQVVLDVALQLLRALAHLHSCGLVHYNLKPSNILVTEVESGLRVRLLDFAPGKLHVASLPGAEAGRPYTAPERLADEAGDARSDLFSIGAILGEILGFDVTPRSGLGALRRLVGRLDARKKE